jgi:hypothetical protein
MNRGTWACAVCALALCVQPLAAVAETKLHDKKDHVAPTPELDVGLLSLVMVAAAGGLTYWRKRNS